MLNIKAAFILTLLTCSIALADETEWKLGSVTLRAPFDGGSRVLVTPDGTKLHEFEGFENVYSSVISKGGSCLLLLVTISYPAHRGMPIQRSYGYLLRISKGSDVRLTAKKVMDRATPFMSKRHRRVSELGAVSDDGTTALLQFSVADADEAPYTMPHVWQTWELDTPKMLSEGLTMDNAKKP
jgi:hypothetical protein